MLCVVGLHDLGQEKQAPSVNNSFPPMCHISTILKVNPK